MTRDGKVLNIINLITQEKFVHNSHVLFFTMGRHFED
ncbi:MAG: hypothetical protein JWO05_2323 [Gemmatimonadetes bacterium]|nr:hypothetical protein [Gemmatimonadota bacterium]